MVRYKSIGAFFEELLNKISCIVSSEELLIAEDRLQEISRCFDICDHQLAQRAGHSADGIRAVFAPDDQFAQHGIVIGRDAVAGINMTVKAHTASAGSIKHFDRSGMRTEIVLRIFRVDPAFDGVAFGLNALET